MILINTAITNLKHITILNVNTKMNNISLQTINISYPIIGWIDFEIVYSTSSNIDFRFDVSVIRNRNAFQY